MILENILFLRMAWYCLPSEIHCTVGVTNYRN